MKEGDPQSKPNKIKTATTEVVSTGLRIAKGVGKVVIGENGIKGIQIHRAIKADDLLRKSMGKEQADEIIRPLWAPWSDLSLSEHREYVTAVRKGHEQEKKESALKQSVDEAWQRHEQETDTVSKLPYEEIREYYKKKAEQRKPINKIIGVFKRGK
jgi:hypothetical protein